MYMGRQEEQGMGERQFYLSGGQAITHPPKFSNCMNYGGGAAMAAAAVAVAVATATAATLPLCPTAVAYRRLE